MRARLSLVLLLACGEPEQLLDVSDSLASIAGVDAQTVSLLRGDRGADANLGCGSFEALRTLKIPLNQPFDFQVLREEAAAPSGARCFRVDWESSLGEHSSITFTPFDHDVALPSLSVWPGSELVGLASSPDFLCGSSCQGFEFAAPRQDLLSTLDDFAFLPPRPFAEAVDSTGVLWRSTYLLVPFNEIFSGTYEADWAEGRSGVSLRAGSVMNGVRYTRDRVGRVVTLALEYRVTTGPLPVAAESSLSVVSRGASCEGFSTCPFTDGDFTPIAVDGLDHVTLDLGKLQGANVVLVRGLWFDGDLQLITVNLEGAADGPFYPLDIVELTRDSLALAQDGLAGVQRLDVRYLTVASLRYVRLVVRDSKGNPLKITRLAEMSVLE
jgi:hypothetical protein